MIGDFLVRLAVALPLVCLAAAATIWAMRRGWLPMPRPRAGPAPRAAGWALPLVARWKADRPAGAPSALEVVEARALGPSARLAVVRFGADELLIGATAERLHVLARRPATPAEPSVEAPAPRAAIAEEPLDPRPTRPRAAPRAARRAAPRAGATA